MFTDCFAERTVPKALAIIAAIIVCAVPCLGIDEKPEFRDYASQGNYFKCSIPAGWSEYSPGLGLSAEEKKMYGLTISGPPGLSGVPPAISIYYYAPGNLLHKTMDLYIRRHSSPVLNASVEGIEYSAVKQIPIAGRDAKTFNRRDVRFIRDQGIDPEKVLIYEEFVVVPAKKDDGFYVLKFSVPCELREINAGTFAAVLKSFVPDN